MKKRRWIASLLLVCTLVGLPHVAEQIWATTAEDKKEQAEEDLKDVNSEMEDIKDNQENIQNEIKDTRTKLKALLAQQAVLAEEIEVTQEAIALTEEQLALAEKEEQEQYEAMKLRIQYMYENSAEDSLWSAIIEADGLTDMLNRVEYISKIHETDRILLQEYQETVDTVLAKRDTLIEQMETLLAKEETYLGQQEEIELAIASLEDKKDEFAAQLAAAKKKSQELKATIAEQERIIEEERKRREEEERRRKEEEKKKQEEALKNSVTGSQIVAFARKYVGNPYVWGGNSLTKGCDCSGFVHLVYKNFGFNLPRYSMSFLNVGTPVKASEDAMQPGDIIIYHKKNGIGHVGIYIGNGKVVEAQSSDKGITDTRDWDCRSIAGVRRIVKKP